MSWIGSALGGLLGGAGSLYVPQYQGQAGNIFPYQGGQYWQGGGLIPVPDIYYEPLYPVLIKHITTGRKLIIWEP